MQVSYRPSNGTEGQMFENTCENCKHFIEHHDNDEMFRMEPPFIACQLGILDRVLLTMFHDKPHPCFYHDSEELDTSTSPARCLKFEVSEKALKRHPENEKEIFKGIQQDVSNKRYAVALSKAEAIIRRYPHTDIADNLTGQLDRLKSYTSYEEVWAMGYGQECLDAVKQAFPRAADGFVLAGDATGKEYEDFLFHATCFPFCSVDRVKEMINELKEKANGDFQTAMEIADEEIDAAMKNRIE